MGYVTTHTDGNYFLSPAQAQIRSLKIYFGPTQRGTGIPSPSNVREIEGFTGFDVVKCGKNLFNETAVTFGKWTDSSGVISDEGRGCISETLSVQGGNTYVLSYSGEQPYSASLIELDSSKTFIKRTHYSWQLYQNNNPIVVTLDNDTNYIYIQVYSIDTKINTNSAMLAACKIQLEFGSAATPYEPYCGQTIPIKFPGIGKNKLDATNYFSSEGFIVFGGDNSAIPDGSIYLPANTYTFSLNTTATLIFGTKSSGSQIISTTNTDHVSFTLNTADSVRLGVYVQGATNEQLLGYQYQLEVGDTATTYEPFNNTIYGGYVDLIAGNVAKEWSIVNLSDLLFTETQTNVWQCDNFCSSYGAKVVTSNDDLGEIVAEKYEICAASSIILGQCAISTTGALIIISDGAPSGKLAYKLATTQIYNILPSSLTTFLHRNTIYSSVHGKVECDYDLYESGIISERRKQILLNTPHLISVGPSSSITFTTDMVAPLKSLKVGFRLWQNGSGTPSPTNIRSIQGRNIFDVSIEEKELFETMATVSGYKNDNGILTASQNSYHTAEMFDINKNNIQYYALRYEKTGDINFRIYFYDEQGQWISRTDTRYYSLVSSPYYLLLSSFQYYVPQNCSKIQFQFNSSVDSSKLKLIQVKTIDITFDQYMYGGYLDVTKGELVQTWGFYETTWGNYDTDGSAATLGSNVRRDFTTPIKFKNLSDLTTSGNHQCNIAQNFGTNADWNVDTVQYILGNNLAILKLPVGTSDDTVIQFAGELDTPITYSLTPTQLNTLVGVNNIWTNTGRNIEVSYYKH